MTILSILAGIGALALMYLLFGAGLYFFLCVMDNEVWSWYDMLEVAVMWPFYMTKKI